LGKNQKLCHFYNAFLVVICQCGEIFIKRFIITFMLIHTYHKIYRKIYNRSILKSITGCSLSSFFICQSFIERLYLFLPVFSSNIVSMDTSINDRLKQARHELQLSQKQFAKGIFLKSSGYIGDIEIYRHEVNNRIIELASSVYGINKDWLLTGKGKMFASGKKIDNRLEEMNILFNQLNPHFKGYVLTQIKNLIKLQNTKGE